MINKLNKTIRKYGEAFVKCKNAAKTLAVRVFRKSLFLDHWYLDYLSPERHNCGNLLRFHYNRNRRFKYNPYTGYNFMLVEDIHTGIVPTRIYASKKEKYGVALEPESYDVSELITDGLGERSYDLADAVFHFISTSAHILAYSGEIVYEIVQEKDEEGKTTSLSFEEKQTDYLFKFLGHYYQVIPWWVAKEIKSRVQVRKVPADGILHIKLPSSFTPKISWMKIKKRLHLLNNTMPQFCMDSMEESLPLVGDLKEYYLNKYLEIASLTKKFGWNQRKYTDEYVTEFYLIKRQLRQMRSYIVLRNHIVSALNQSLSDLLGVKYQLKLINLLEEKDIDAMEQELQNGDLKFSDLVGKIIE